MSPEASREPGVHAPPPALAPRLRAVLIVIAVVAVLAAALGIVSRMRARTTLKDVTRATAAPTVAVVKPEPGAPAQELILPASVQAFTDAPGRSHVADLAEIESNGWSLSVPLYVSSTDIGERVTLAQALADLAAARAAAERTRTALEAELAKWGLTA